MSVIDVVWCHSLAVVIPSTQREEICQREKCMVTSHTWWGELLTFREKPFIYCLMVGNIAISDSLVDWWGQINCPVQQVVMPCDFQHRALNCPFGLARTLSSPHSNEWWVSGFGRWGQKGSVSSWLRSGLEWWKDSLWLQVPESLKYYCSRCCLHQPMR